MKVSATSGVQAALVAGLCLWAATKCIPLAAYAGGQGLSGNIGRAATDQRSVNQASRVSLPVVRPTLDCRNAGEAESIPQSHDVGVASVGLSSLDMIHEEPAAQLDHGSRQGAGDGPRLSGIQGNSAELSLIGCPPPQK
jgi:hypothetical protein